MNNRTTILAALGLEAPELAEQMGHPVLGGGRPVGWMGPAAGLAELAGV